MARIDTTVGGGVEKHSVAFAMGAELGPEF
jgi:hypothetical protein